MATDKKRDAEIDNRQERLINEKPVFTISDRQLFVNLHNAATQKAAEKLQKTYSLDMIHDIFINTGMSEDGRTVEYKSKVNVNTIQKLFSASSKQYEVGLVLQFTDFKYPSDEDIKKNGNDKYKAIFAINAEGFKKLHQTAFDTLHEYFFYFANTDVKEPKMVEFIPDYNGEKVKIEDYKILSMDAKKQREYFENRNFGKNSIPRLGYKFGYTLNFDQ